MVEDRALTEISMPAKRIASSVMEDTKQQHNGKAFKGLDVHQMEQLVYRARHKEFRDWESQIESFPLCYFDPGKDHRFFLQFNMSVNVDNELQKIIGWAHPDLIFLTAHGACNLFLDCTFKVVPKGFSQLLIVMVYSRAHCSYVPVFYILLQSKKENTYFYALQAAISATGWRLDACSVTCDFEQALISAVKSQFRKGALFIGCYFHWKQAIKRKLIERALPKELVKALIGKNGAMNILPLVPIEDIVPKAIPYIRTKVQETGHKAALDSFWRYFVSTWMKKYSPLTWNINHIPQGREEDIMINRTNCALERYNKTLQNAFPSPHPNIQVFVQTIAGEARRIAIELENIQKGFVPMPQPSEANIPLIPEDYYVFKM
jgi:hypothetical protein